MGKGTRICLAILLAIAVVGQAWLASREREPAYNGRKLSEWLTICRSTGTSQDLREQAASAVRHIGTNGLPLLLRRAADTPPQIRQKVGDYIDQHSLRFIPRFVRDWTHKPPDHTRAYEARIGLTILGPDAAPAIPFLRALSLASPVQNNTFWAVGALGDIGPVALPVLLTILTNSVAPTRGPAATQIARFGSNAAPALPTLIHCLDDQDYRVAEACAEAIGNLAVDPEQSIPALLQCLHKIDPTLRTFAVLGIMKFGANARHALPQLREAAVTEKDYQTKALLQWAIQKLDATLPTYP